MSSQEPKFAYVYQPGPVGSADGKLWGVAGPGTRAFEGVRMTREDAAHVSENINLGKLTPRMLILLGRTPEAVSAINAKGR